MDTHVERRCLHEAQAQRDELFAGVESDEPKLRAVANNQQQGGVCVEYEFEVCGCIRRENIGHSPQMLHQTQNEG